MSSKINFILTLLITTAISRKTKETEYIIGGSEVTQKKYPFIVRANGCGASLIAPDRILSAAHCKDLIVKGVTIDTLGWSGGKQMKVSKVWVYPGGSGKDVLVAQIWPPVQNIKPILLDSGKQGFSNPGATNKVIGWGDTQLGEGVTVPNRLQEMTGTILTQTQCKNVCDDNWWPMDTEICMGRNERHNIGAGDSGSPLFYELRGDFIQTGIVHGATDCQKYGIFARVSKFTDWLIEKAPNARSSDSIHGRN